MLSSFLQRHDYQISCTKLIFDFCTKVSLPDSFFWNTLYIEFAEVWSESGVLFQNASNEKRYFACSNKSKEVKFLNCFRQHIKNE